MTDRIGHLKVGRAVIFHDISFKDVRVGTIGAYYKSERQSKSTNYADSSIKYTPNVSSHLCIVGNLCLEISATSWGVLFRFLLVSAAYLVFLYLYRTVLVWPLIVSPVSGECKCNSIRQKVWQKSFYPSRSSRFGDRFERLFYLFYLDVGIVGYY